MAFLDLPSSSSSPSPSPSPSPSSFMPTLLSNIVPEDSTQRELREALESAAGRMAGESAKPVRPLKGFCVKFRRSDQAGQKVFINICHTTELPEPADISERELTDLLESEDAASYRVPLSLGMFHDEVDKKGESCVAYDVIINSKFFRKCCEQRMFKEFVTLLAAQGVEDKWSITLCRDDYVTLVNKKYMGSMPEHYIRDRGTSAPAPLIDEVEPADKGDQSAQPNVQLCRVQKPGRCVEHLVADVQIAGLDSAENICLEMAKDRIVVQRLPGPTPEVDVCLPLEVNLDAVKAHYDCQTCLLRIDVPISRVL